MLIVINLLDLLSPMTVIRKATLDKKITTLQLCMESMHQAMLGEQSRRTDGGKDLAQRADTGDVTS